MINKKRKIEFIIFGALAVLFLLVFATVISTGYFEGEKERLEVRKGEVTSGQVEVDPGKNKIRFPARVRRTEGKITFLLHLRGYEWLKEQSALVSPAHLAHLQEAIALLDWELWDYLWYNQELPDGYRLEIILRGADKTVESPALVHENPALVQLLFFGTPYFDEVALGTSSILDCRNCPLYSREKQLIEEEITGGRQLTLQDFPFHKGEKVEVTIQVEIAEEQL